MNMFGSKKGVSLVEVLISAVILVIVAVVFLQSYISCIKLASMSKETLFALNSAAAKLEEVRSYTFSSIYSYYNNGAGHTFKVAELNPGDSMGIVSVDNSNPNLLKVAVTVCWRHMGAGIVGEDTNLDGILQSSEDANNNGEMDSPVKLATYIVRP